MHLFEKKLIIGIFYHLNQKGLEFHGEFLMIGKEKFKTTPLYGQFIVVELDTEHEALLGRIISYDLEPIDIRFFKKMNKKSNVLLKGETIYKIHIRFLGILRENFDSIRFSASYRKFPREGNRVSFLSYTILYELLNNPKFGSVIGHFSLGEHVFNSKMSNLISNKNIPTIPVRFSLDHLVSKRSFIFARAGFGKSNLNKLLFSQLYLNTPMIQTKNNHKSLVGTIIFDSDGEYFWPDVKGRPGLCDVPHLRDQLVIFTPRESPSQFYDSFKVGGVRLDIRRLNPADVIAIALGLDKQNQQNIRKLRGLNLNAWEELVNLVDLNGHMTSLSEICRILQLNESQQEMEAMAARANMTEIVKMLHERSSRLMDLLIQALTDGKLCIIDVSQMRRQQALVLAGLILKKIFDKNQKQFTSATSKMIPTIAVVEEAQTILNKSSTSLDPFITWVKEGRKYDLGIFLITQQPGSIPSEILSQGDNWFVFHLLSMLDLISVKKANSNFGEDILSSLLNESIPGQGFFWSSANQNAFPVPIRILSFENMYSVLDPNYNKEAIITYAYKKRNSIISNIKKEGIDSEVVSQNNVENLNTLDDIEYQVIQKLSKDALITNITEEGIPWGRLKAFFLNYLPETFEDRDQLAFNLVSKGLTSILGDQNIGWKTYYHSKRKTTYIKVLKKLDGV